jgi:GAF domain-containing protein
MSQRNRKYKRIEALFSEVQPVAPDSPLQDAAKTPADDTRPVSVVPPTAVSPASGQQDILNGINRGQKIGFTYDQEKVTSLEEAPLPLLENALCVPLMVSGTTIGTIQAAGNEAGWTAQEIEIISAVAAQLAQHIENLRLLEQNEKHTHE